MGSECRAGWRIDLATGDTVGMMESGKGQAAAETAVLEGNAASRTATMLRFARSLCTLTGYLFTGLLIVSVILLYGRIFLVPASAATEIKQFIRQFLSLNNLLFIAGTYAVCRAVSPKLEAFSEGEPGGAPGRNLPKAIGRRAEVVRQAGRTWRQANGTRSQAAGKAVATRKAKGTRSEAFRARTTAAIEAV